MTTIENQMKVADTVLSKLETFDPTCILAGGAPRDWFLGNTATDLDFFVYWRPEFEMQKWRYLTQLRNLGFKHVQERRFNCVDIPENYKRNPYLIAVYEFIFKGEKIQIMFMKAPTFTSVVPLFPFGICQAWYKRPLDTASPLGDTGIQVTHEFRLSVNHKILRVLNELYNDGDGYIEKIRAKFPDYLFIGKGE